MKDDYEPIIDPLLEEALGSVRPPDLTQRILAAHAESMAAGSLQNTDSIDAADELGQPGPLEFDVSLAPAADRLPRRRYDWRGWILAASVLLLAGGIAWWGQPNGGLGGFNDLMAELGWPAVPPGPADLNNGKDERGQLAAADAEVDPDEGGALPPHDGTTLAQANTGEANANQANTDQGTSTTAPDADSPQFAHSPAQSSPDTQLAEPANTPYQPPQFRRQLRIGRARSVEQVVGFVNGQLQEVWQANGVQPTKPISEPTWLARTSQALVGRGPSAEEMRAFQADGDREAAVDRLLETPEFVAKCSDMLTDVLVGAANPDRFDREQLAQFLRRNLASETPYDQLAYELLTAVGSTDRSAEDYNAAANFLLAHQGRRRDQYADAADKSCQVFLGTQLQCARCHDHKSNALGQNQYWQVAAFFSQTKMERPGDGSARLYNESTSAPEVIYELPNLLSAVAEPVFLDGSPTRSLSGQLEDVDQRVELAYKIVSSEGFALATINRLWDSTFGMGFTHPVDDMGPHNPPSHPRLLAGLAREFSNNRFDLRAAFKWMVLSAAFDREVRPAAAALASDSPSDLFASFAPERRRYPQIARTFSRYADQMRRDANFDRTVLLAQQAESTASTDQVVAEMNRANGKLRLQLLNGESGGLIHRLVENRELNNRQRVAHLFWATVGRRPRGAEMQGAMKMLTNGRDDVQTMQDIGWILLNSHEFATQH